MEFAEEWARSKADAAVGTRLNGWDEGPATGRGMPQGGGAAADLKVSPQALRGLSKTSTTLSSRANTALSNLTTAHEGLAAATTGFTSTTTLTTVRATWEKRLRDARAECQKLRDAFANAAKIHDAGEEDTKAKMSSLSTGSENRPKSKIADFS